MSFEVTLRQRRPAFLAVLMLTSCVGLSYQDRGDGSVQPAPLEGAAPPTYEKYASPLESRVTDSRFTTLDAMYLANEMNQGGFPFFESAVAQGLIASDPEFLYATTVESYWYSRYNMSALVTESRLGVHAVYGPYVTEHALRNGRASVNRDRGEYARSNKAALVQDLIPTYLARTGFPRRFEDASPTMLHFASGDPHFVRPLDKGVAFESTENEIRDADLRQLYGEDMPARESGMDLGGNDMWTSRVNYRENFLSMRWDHDGMEHEVDLGAEGQALMKMVLWMEYFFRGSHHRGQFLGNDPEEGFRACMLNLMAVNKMLMLKGAMLSDGESLSGVDPREFVAGAHYFPHRIGVRMRSVGDLPARPEELFVADATSQLFDQASLLWALSEYYHFADPAFASNWNNVFGENPPYDGSVMEQKYIVLAQGLANMTLENIQAMHRRQDGHLDSAWSPGGRVSDSVTTRDLGMTLVALANFARHLHVDPERVAGATDLLRREADFLVDVLQGDDGSVAARYDFATGQTQERGTLLAQGFAIRGLMEAHKVVGDARYMEAAKRAYDYMNRDLWDDSTGVYRSSPGAQVSVYTPMNLGAALGAMREMILATNDASELERYKRFWVQGVNRSGIQQAEYEETGERDFFAPDGDRDGIPRMEYGPGRYGVAPVYASRVEIATPSRSEAAGTR